MEKIEINKLGPIQHCELTIDKFMIFTGPQASGKSTISKSIFFFKNIKNLLSAQLNKRFLSENDLMELSTKNRLIKEIRSAFLQTFGSTWCMEKDMSLEYHYSDAISVRISLEYDENNPNYIWIDFSQELIKFLDSLDQISQSISLDIDSFGKIKKQIDEFFEDDSEVVYIPAGRSLMTLFSTQLMYMYSVMNDDQKRSLDYCTQNYLERIMQLKPLFSHDLNTLIKNKMELTDEKIDKENLKQCVGLIREILHGEYRMVHGEERLQLSEDRYVKINFASSGQQESIWILYVLFYYLLNNKKAYFIIEEPESHLFPNAQKLITEFISLVKNNGSRVLMTTHSPYILGTINNLLYANKISEKVDASALEKVVSHLKRIDFKDMSAHYVEHGEVQSCMDEELESIENEIIDGASDDINAEFEKMLEFVYGTEED